LFKVANNVTHRNQVTTVAPGGTSVPDQEPLFLAGSLLDTRSPRAKREYHFENGF
jgi:hypothetical protein